MNIHYYTSLVPNSGDIRRIKNIDEEISSFYGSPSVEVTFWGLSDISKIKANGKFKVGGVHNKKYYIFQPPKVNYYFPIYHALVLGILGLIYKPKVFVGEMNFPYKLRKVFKFFNPKVRIVADIHGAIVEELTYLKPDASNKDLRYHQELEKRTIIDSDIIICQSDEMKKYIIDKYNVKEDKMIVYRCGYDTLSFGVNQEYRREARTELGIKDNEVLFVYSGGLHGWQKIEESLLLFRNYFAFNQSSKMLILTGDKEVLNELLTKDDYSSIKDRVISFSVPFASVSKYLNAADVAFLMRDNHTMNAVASPTKLAEYLACGLPIITNEVAHHWVSDEALNYLIFADDGENVIEKIDSAIRNNNKMEEEVYSKNNLSLAIDKSRFRESFELMSK